MRFRPILLSIIAVVSLPGVAPAQTTGGQYPLSIEYVGSTLWSDFDAVDVVGDYAYVAAAYGLMIFDISDPTMPTLISQVELPDGQGLDVAVSGNYAYVADEAAGFQIVEISDPYHPVVMGQYDTPGRAQAVAVSNAYAYVADESVDLEIYDISNPMEPTLVGYYDSPAELKAASYGVAVSGSTAYVALGNAGLVVLDVANPAEPIVLGRQSISGFARHVALSGNLAFVGDSYYLYTVNVLDLAHPTLVSMLRIVGGVAQIVVDGGFVYVAAGSGGVAKVDISNPALPLVVAQWLTGDWRNRVYDVAPLGNRVFATAVGGGLIALDASSADSLFVVGSYASGHVESVAMSGHLAYVADGLAGMRVLDLSDPSVPTLISAFDTRDHSTDIALQGELAYIADDDSALLILDIADPTSPAFLGEAIVTRPREISRVAVSGSYAYINSVPFGPGFGVIDVSTPSSPFFVTGFNTYDFSFWYGMPVLPRDVSAWGNYAYMTYLDYLDIIDMSDPSNSCLVVKKLTTGRGPLSVRAEKNYAYFTSAAAALVVVNVSNPEAAMIVADYGTLRRGNGLAISENYAYVGSEAAGLEMVNVSDPRNPFLAASNPVPRYGSEIATSGTEICVADGSALLIFRRSVIVGDANDDGFIKTSDIVALINYVLKGGPEPMPVAQSGDVDCTGTVDLADITFLVMYVFKGGPAPSCP